MELINSPLFNDANLVSYWRMEGNSNDSKGGHNGSDTSVSYGTQYGKFGQGAYYNGSANTAIASATPFAIQTFSIVGWIKTSQTSEGGIFTTYLRLGDNNGYIFEIVSNKLRLTLYRSSGTQYQSLWGSATVNDGNWHHVAVVKSESPNTAIFYVDGIQDGSPSTGYDNPTLSGVVTIIGNRDGLNEIPYTGNIDDLSFFNRALTATEIKSLYNSSSGFFLNMI